MVNPDSVNYGALYSFEPDFLRQVNDDVPVHEEQDSGYAGPVATDTVWSGILARLVLILMIRH